MHARLREPCIEAAVAGSSLTLVLMEQRASGSHFRGSDVYQNVEIIGNQTDRIPVSEGGVGSGVANATA